jgi:sugar fermentation stimulation protein A
MKFEHKVYEGIIQKRYKRFLSDITLKDGQEVTAHVANTGSMKMCWAPGWKVAVTYVDDPKRKLKYSLQMTHNGKTWIGINTSLTNKLVKEALENEVIKELNGYEKIKPEAKVLDSRIDFLLTSEGEPECYVEVKNVTLISESKKGQGLFPDAVSTRGQKHLKDLIKLKKQGQRAVMLYICQREDIEFFSPASDIDPEYARLLKEAKKNGVEILCYGCSLSKKEIIITKTIEVKI